MASLLLIPLFTCSLPHCTRARLHCESNIWGQNMIRPEMRLHSRNVTAVSRNNSHDVAEDASDGESDSEGSKPSKGTRRYGRRKVNAETSGRSIQEDKMNLEVASPEATKKVKRRGRKKATATASSEEVEDKLKEPKRVRRKVKTVEELSSNDEGEDHVKQLTPSDKGVDQIEEHMSAQVLETQIELLLLEKDSVEFGCLTPLVCCFGPAKYSFIPSGRPANRLTDHEIHDRMKEMFWSPDKFVRAPGGPSSNVALALVALGGQVVFMGKLGDDEYGESLLYHLNINGVQTRAVRIDPSAPTAVSLMKITGQGSLKMSCAKPCAEDCFVQTDINPAVLKEAKMFYYNSSALLEPTTRSSLTKALEISKKFGGITFFDLNLPLPLWATSKETNSLIKEAWEAADIIEVTKQELEFLCGIKPSEKFDTKDNDKSKFTHYKPEVVMKLWHENLKVLFVTNGSSKIHYYTEKHNGWVHGMEDPPITPFTSDMSQSGDAIVAALMRMLTINPHLVTDKVYLDKAIKHAIKCGVIDQWLLARERGFLPKERADPTSEQYEVRSITEKEYRTIPDAMQSENLTNTELQYVD